MEVNETVNIEYEGLIEEIKKEFKKVILESLNEGFYSDYLTTADVRKYLGGVSANTLTKFCRQGLKRVSIDGIRLYKRADVEEFLDSFRE